jgi:hypothetical protein
VFIGDCRLMAGWIGIADRAGRVFRPDGLRGSGPERAQTDAGLLPKGAIVVETRLPQSLRPKPILNVEQDGPGSFHLSLQALPGGALSFVLNQGAGYVQRTIDVSSIGRTDVLRITYSWNALQRAARLTVERLEGEHLLQAHFRNPKPFRLCEIDTLLAAFDAGCVAPELSYVAVSNRAEPVGPMPTMTPDTRIATPSGYRPIRELRRGDLVVTPQGESVPVLHKVARTVPARGCFRPVRVRAPFFGLQQDILVAPSQRLVLAGSEVEYLFGEEAVLVELRHLIGEPSVHAEPCGSLVTYEQLILPNHEAVLAAGTQAESLYIGKIRSRRRDLRGSLLAALDPQTLPEHARSRYRVLGAFDAIVLAEQRAA